MAYRIFLSHSIRDQGLVVALSRSLYGLGIDEVFLAEWYLTPGESLSRKVFTHIDRADCIVALLTRNGVRSTWVNQEIGYALGKRKLVIPLVEKGTDSKELSSLQGYEYIEYDPFSPGEALFKVSTYVQSLKAKKEEKEKAVLVAGGIMTFLLLLSGTER